MKDDTYTQEDWVTIQGQVPSKSNSYRIVTIRGHGSLAKTSALKEYEKSFFMQCGKLRDRMIEGLFELYIDVYYSSMRPDLDNSLKIILDCLQSVKAIKNDNQCVTITARKFVDKDNPRVLIKLTSIGI